MRELFQILGGLLQGGGDVVLATVIASSGSTPRGPGARMLVTAEGLQSGTIGGGPVEYEAIRTAQELLRTKTSRIARYRLHPGEAQDLGMICGGETDVYFRYVPASELALMERIEELYHRAETGWLICELPTGDGPPTPEMGVYGEDSGAYGIDVSAGLLGQLGNKPVQIEADGRRFFCENLAEAGVVYIFGGGHVTQALVPVLATVRFRCVVLDDRADFCRPVLFPGAEDTRLIDTGHIADAAAIGKDDYVVILTRGHKDDQTVLTQALQTHARYIGMIGSARKSAVLVANLRAQGFTERDIKRINTPIGLDIGAETAEEIAISIAAQLIRERSGGLRIGGKP